MLRASIDLMGGQQAPIAILEAASQFPDIHFVFVGTKAAQALIVNYNIKNYSFVEAQVILEEGKRSADMEKSSLYIAVEQVAKNNADFVLSAGPTGYYMLFCKRLLGTLGGLNRPALAAIWPTLKGTVMLDLGANLTCTGNDLAKFAVMGVTLAKFWLNRESPNVGFVNVGSEVGKGPDNIKEALEIFSNIKMDATINATAKFVECDDIMEGDYDVIVADGFTGNCLMKLGEGVARFLKHRIKSALTSNIFTKLLAIMLRGSFKKALIDSKEYNGAILAGINGCIIKSHGNSDAQCFKSAIRLGIKVAQHKQELLNIIEKGLISCGN